MPFPMKIQPIDFKTLEEAAAPRSEAVKQPAVKSRFKRLFERPFPSVLRNYSTEKIGAVAVIADELPFSKECSAEFEPSSVCLAKMVQNFIEEHNEKQQSCAVRCSGRNRCNCFSNRSCSDSSDDEMDGFFGDSNLNFSAEASEILKSLVSPMTVNEKKVLADTAKIMEKNKNCKSKDEVCRKIVTDGLLTLGYDASICKSFWGKSPSFPAGEYEYIDVLIEGERLLIDMDFRSEFELARTTKTYKSILQTLPHIFVGKANRLQKIIAIVSEAVKQCLKKKGMHIPPWRKAEYIKAKWLSHYNRITPSPTSVTGTLIEFGLDSKAKDKGQSLFEVTPEDKNSVGDAELGEPIFALSESFEEDEGKGKNTKNEEWKIGVKMVTGLASAIEDEMKQ
ncbi:hypothetical protein F3Y22_tig00018191pilonHSYRG00029 [Hibiscus syriacus]|uniref:Uncharacterized protein n=1 Tax=Hibiscus syriacus TaxID=106335 RepID=A0A6A3BXW8_HIBSY|nr:uncharacterized protein LOC120209182 isoform X2 [Hibiscus syriacus]KAE8720781.1 hypothetical protein F3Y22_tig00018191pilonHSYRG00029 [Hibiscus syriacus]